MAVYLAAMVWFILGNFRKGPPRSDQQPTVSVILAARGACRWLPRLVDQLGDQDYPAEKLQIVLVDDGLDSGMKREMEGRAGRYPNLLIVSSAAGDQRLNHKNRALDAGIKKSAGTVLMFTDADCQVGPGWVSSMASHFTAQIDYVVGWSQIGTATATVGSPGSDATPQPESSRQLFEAVDFMVLMLAARGAVRMGTPWASSGQNQAYRRSLFDLVGGFEEIIGRLQGDDSLFLQIARRRGAARVVFADDPAAMVRTEPSDNLGHFLRQRIRWAADALAMVVYNPWFFPLPVATFLVNALIVVMTILSLPYPDLWLTPLILSLLVKAAFEWALVALGAKRMKLGHLARHFPQWFALQIPYVTLMGIMSFFGNRLSWKDRAAEPKANASGTAEHV